MSLQAFIPELWSDVLLTALRKTLVYAGPGVVNHDYEGDIQEYGDTVRITSIGRPTVTPYVPNVSTITPQAIITAGQTLNIDQAYSWAFSINDVDAAQARGSVMESAMSEAAYSLAAQMDLNVAGLYTKVNSGNVVPSVTITATGLDGSTTAKTWAYQAALAYDTILVPLKVQLDIANVPQVGRYVVLPPWLHGVLLRDPRFVKVNESGTDEGLRNGMVGRAAGFDILMSNNTPVPTANNYIVTAGVSSAITFASQIIKTEAYRPQNDFADAVKGLGVWGSEVVRPDALAYCQVVAA
jgi:hypothetical protein